MSGANVFLTCVASADATIEGSAEQNNDLSLGATYMMNDYTLFGEYRSEGNAGDADATTQITLGAGKTMAMSDSATVFYDVKLVSTGDQATGVVGATDASMALPVTFGVESKATSWLTMRASISQQLLTTQSIHLLTTLSSLLQEVLL